MRRQTVERLVATLFVISIVSGLALGAVYWGGGQPQLEGTLLALSLGGIGIGMVAWAKKFLPNEEVEEERKPIESAEEDVAAFTRDYEAGEQEIGRRRLLGRLLLGALGSLGLAALFPVRSLGPRPGRGLFQTAFEQGVRVVTAAGDPVKPADLGRGVVLTVWPDGAVGDADSPTLLIGVGEPELFSEETRPGTVDGVVAYSKLCTHTGCPVGLYQQEERLLLCPCHQSTFEVLNGAKPIFGPATRSLPQLPLDLDDEGYIIATGDFESPAGPGFWNRQDHD